MGWLAAVIGAIFFIWLLVASPGFRTTMFWLAVVGAAGGYWWYDKEQREEAAAGALGAKLVREKVFELGNAMMLNRSYGTGTDVKIDVINHSNQYSLERLALKVTVREPKGFIHDESVVVFWSSVPPGYRKTLQASGPYWCGNGCEWGWSFESAKAK